MNMQEDRIETEGATIYNFSFLSKAQEVIPGYSHYRCREHGVEFPSVDHFTNNIGPIGEPLDECDTKIAENHTFRYQVFTRPGSGKSGRMTLLLHGFNEKHWDKYLPWAMELLEQTGRPVILFPIAFHMNRAPHSWSERRIMYELAEQRKKQYPHAQKSTLSNVAISMRLHFMPQRFIWSGLQTYYDIIELAEQINSGNHPLFEPGCTIDFFSYSIGSLLAEILKLSNHHGYFSHSKLCMFCGGAVFNRLSPVSRFILDSEANVALYSYLVEHIDSHMKSDPRLRHYLSDAHPEGRIFYSMLDYRAMMEYREQKFREIEHQVLAIALRKDTVIPAYEIVNTLQGTQRDIRIPVEILDYPYEYIHELPFPTQHAPEEEVEKAFRQTFEKVAGFLS